MIARVLVGALDVGLGRVVRAEELDVHRRVLIADRLVGVESERLMMADGPAHLFVHVGLDELRAPVAVVTPDEPADGNVVDQAGQDDLLAGAVLPGQARALHQVSGRGEAVLEEVEQGRPLGHPGQTWIVPHHVEPAVVGRPGDGRARVALPRRVDDGLHHDPIQLLAQGMFGGFGLL